MIEKTVLDYLNGKLSVPVYVEKPEKAPDSYCIVERVGGSQKNHLSQATFAIRSIAPTLYAAASLDLAMRKAMEGITEEKNVSGCYLNADTNYTNTAKKEYRYQATFIIYYMEV